ncbi:glycosyltransferase family 2 protein [Alisedimentitalea sp. MJ-SS2]|uniref:glycosyltransferase family 2 protein n=1 Tax=Aliisedimentitalea sp. MJ-SS2 TaxID=3049795 RepID=UPI00290CC48E|nr:glycosyltransferase family 2 protein [Alisedimentitalea sp. MJ-SS2]MDU8926221.1 glycosyltransferase family 2 protein [Alisedimentitalea sp. MJ-SS2]
MSVVIPAANEGAYIGRCLDAMLASDPKPGAGSGSIALPMPVEVIVVANGCSDDTAAIARARAPHFRAMGWDFKVLELGAVGKPGALNAGDRAAKFGARVYLDADVVVSKPLLDMVGRALQTRRPVLVSGQVRIATPQKAISKLYAKTYERVPFMTYGVPACGLFAVNELGRQRWRDWPEIISDDTFARLNFAADERIGVGACYLWPIVEGWDRLVRVRARQNAGVREVMKKFPDLKKNDDKPRLGLIGVLGLALRNPPSFAVYAGVALATKFRRGDGWTRGR